MQSQGPGSPSKPHCNIFPTPAPTSSLPPTYLLPCLWPFAISKQSVFIYTTFSCPTWWDNRLLIKAH